MELSTVPIEKPDEVNMVLGQAHFIKTVEDVYEAWRVARRICASGSLCASRPARGSCGGPETTRSSWSWPSATRSRSAQFTRSSSSSATATR